MKDISLIVMQLKNRQVQIERKINQLIDQNLDPFPFERLEKGKQLIDSKNPASRRRRRFDPGRYAYQGIGNSRFETGPLKVLPLLRY